MLLLDVSPLLGDQVQIVQKSQFKNGLKFDDIVLDPSITAIDIPAYSCNEATSFFDLSKCPKLQKIFIGFRSFECVSQLHIHDMHELRTIEFASRAFMTSVDSEPSGAFSVVNCEKLQSIRLGPLSLTHFNNEFSLVNLPELTDLQIGVIGDYSSNFYQMSFCVKGRFDARSRRVDLPKLKRIILGNEAFQYSQYTYIESRWRDVGVFCVDLPELESLHIGENALMGKESQDCRMVMKSRERDALANRSPEAEKVYSEA